jgi:hypothetical protein
MGRRCRRPLLAPPPLCASPAARFGGAHLVAALHDELAAAAGHQRRKHLAEVLCDALEGALDGLVLAHVQRGDELLDLVLCVCVRGGVGGRARAVCVCVCVCV